MAPVWQLDWLVSAGRLTDVLPPVAFALSAVASAFVLHDARRRALSTAASAAWTLLSLVLPHVVIPIYLVARLYARRPADATAEASTAEPSDEETPEDAAPDGDGATPVGPDASAAPRVGRRLALPAVYAASVLACGALYFYLDYRSVDARLARAEQAKLENRTASAVEEYRSALARRDDPHVRKLLGVELSRMGRWEEALAEFRAAERGGEQDDALVLRLASALDALGRPEEATAYYESYLAGGSCTGPLPAHACDGVRRRVGGSPADGRR